MLRSLVALTAIACLIVLGTGCGSGSTNAGADPGPTTRVVEHSQGRTEIPRRAERIVTLTDQNALLPLLELGVKPVASAGQELESGQGRFRRTDGFDTSGIDFVGDFTAPNLERIAAARPDLIVGYDFNEDVYDETTRIAPTVLIDVFGQPLPEALTQFAAIVGREDRGAQLRRAYERRVADLKRRLADRQDALTVSLISAGGQPSAFARADSGQALKAVADDLGLRRPAEQTGERNIDGEDISLERLSRHDADVVLVVDYGADGQSEARPVVASEPYKRLAATRAGQSYVIDGTRTVGAAWARMDAFLDVLELRLLDPELDTGVVD